MSKTILFTGDSITDGNRYKDENTRWDLNHQMGHSFAYVINALLGSAYPERDYRFVNRGVSGNRIIDIYARMYEDILEIRPDLVSILVGINDGPGAAHAYHATSPERYGTHYRMLLNELKKVLPDVQLIICEPFIGQETSSFGGHYNDWRKCVHGYQLQTEKIAEEFGAVFVPLQECFNKAFMEHVPEYWIWDGIHPTENGHGLIARQWLKYAKNSLGLKDLGKNFLF